MPGCPMHLSYELPLGTEGRKIARKHEIAKRRTAGTSVKTSREVAGLTQGEQHDFVAKRYALCPK